MKTQSPTVRRKYAEVEQFAWLYPVSDAAKCGHYVKTPWGWREIVRIDTRDEPETEPFHPARTAEGA